jgi:hypothetical protein
VRADGHVLRLVPDGRVDELRVVARQVIGIEPAAARGLAHLRVAEVGEVGVVELQVGEACIAQLLDLLAVGGGDIVEECVEIRVCGLADAFAPAAEMQHRGRGDRNLRRPGGDRLEELEILELDRLCMLHLAGDLQHRRCEAHVAALGVELRGEAGVRLHAVQLLEEVDVEVLAAEFSVRDPVQAEAFLELHDVADRLVLDLAKLGLGDLALAELFACVDHRLRAQEAADVVGAERRLVACGHG